MNAKSLAARGGVKVAGGIIRGGLAGTAAIMRLRQKSYDKQAMNEILRQNAKPTHCVSIHVQNLTTFTLSSPRVYFKRGMADINPKFELEPNTPAEWHTRSCLLARKTSVEGLLMYSISPSSSLVIMFSVNCRMRTSFWDQLCRERYYPNAWAGKIIDHAPDDPEGQAALYQAIRRDEDEHIDADGNSHELTFRGSPLKVVGEMNPYTYGIQIQIIQDSSEGKLATIPERSMSQPET